MLYAVVALSILSVMLLIICLYQRTELTRLYYENDYQKELGVENKELNENIRTLRETLTEFYLMSFEAMDDLTDSYQDVMEIESVHRLAEYMKYEKEENDGTK